MAEPKLDKTDGWPDLATATLIATNSTSRTSNINAEPMAEDRGVHDALSKPVQRLEPRAYFAETLSDAERLLKYATETGISVDDEVRNQILQAMAIGRNGWSEEMAANLFSAVTKLAAQVKPVTPESLKWYERARSTVHTYLWVAICLAGMIVPFSVASFLASAISTAIRTDIEAGNQLAVKLRVELGTPPALVQATPSAASAPSAPTATNSTESGAARSQDLNTSDVITDLQQFASTNRAIYARARQLNVLLLHRVRDPYGPAIRSDPNKAHETFQLPDGLPNLAAAAGKVTRTYKDVRYFAQNLLDDVSFYYGAFTACVLPVLYALLGTCAFLVRSFEQQMSTRTFVPSETNLARFLIAGIGGAVVGLFNNFTITQGISIPPLALAFLVGYAVDVFFAFLESLLQSFTRNVSGPSPQPIAGAKTQPK
jgi:hypothetical protein